VIIASATAVIIGGMGPQTIKGHVTLTTYISELPLAVVNLSTKFEVSNSTGWKDI